MRILILSSLLLSLNLFASEISMDSLQKNYCQYIFTKMNKNNFYRINPLMHKTHYGSEYFFQRANDSSGDYILSYEDKKIRVKAKGLLRDFIVHSRHLWTVGQQGMTKYTLDGALVKTFEYRNPDFFDDVGMKGIAATDDGRYFYIAAEKKGIVKFDPFSEQFIFQDFLNTENGEGQKSQAIAINRMENGKFLILLNARTAGGLNGVGIYNPFNDGLESFSAYKVQDHGAIGLNSKVYEYGKYIYLNNSGWIHRIEKQSLQTEQFVTPGWLSIMQKEDGYHQYIMMRGDLIFSQNEIKGCGIFKKRVPNKKAKRYGLAYSVKI